MKQLNRWGNPTGETVLYRSEDILSSAFIDTVEELGKRSSWDQLNRLA
jgi:hypothetical protein